MSIDKPAFKGDDYDFAAGSIKGLRSWQIDDRGRLRGVTHPAVWLPVENASTCRIKPRCPNATAVARDEGYFSLPRSLVKPCTVPGCDGMEHPAPHTFDPDCECGFWAYDEVGFKEHGDVSGVIEGYGLTTIGTKGFRCAKARVVALCREREDDPLTLSEWLRLKQLYPDAAFYDDWDDMVLRHGAVMRTWPEVGEGFWDDEGGVEAEPYRLGRTALYNAIYAHYGMSAGNAIYRGLQP